MSAAPRLSRSFATLVALAVLMLRPATAAAGASVDGARCRVTLTKLSYDDPGTDDAEFIELHVDRTASGDDVDAGVTDASDSGGDAGLTLGACGLAAIELIDGQGGACSVYRNIPLGDVAVPDDDVVVLCSAGAAFAAKCDVTAAGRSALKDGWLQNGPNDGVRLRSTSATVVEIGYEPPPACFAATALRLPDEAGQVGETAPVDSPVDDVSVFCDGKFVLLAATDAPLRALPACPREPAPHRGEPWDAGDGPPAPPGASPTHRPLTGAVVDASGELDAGYVPERAPTPRESPSKDDPLFRTDASAGAPPDLRGMPKPPGCATRALSTNAEGAPAGTLLLVVAFWRVFRRPRRRPSWCRGPLRAGSSARCGWSPPRSPSR